MNIDNTYKFMPEDAFNAIEEHWRAWDKSVSPKCYVVGISGGIDSTCVAALACKMFGNSRVVGVSLPCNGQVDSADVDQVFEHLHIRRVTIDIGDMFMYGINAIENQAIEMTSDCRTNMPARIRMTMLYGVAQCLGGVVVNTCNRSEDVVGYSTLYGDNAGSYSPLQSLTKTEVKALAAWLDVPIRLVNKTPIDGLQPLSDEEKLGITYAEIDNYIRGGKTSIADEAFILDKFAKNKFKLEIVKLPGPKFEDLPDKIRENFKL